MIIAAYMKKNQMEYDDWKLHKLRSRFIKRSKKQYNILTVKNDRVVSWSH